MFKRTNNIGMTLIELMVVVAIVAVLAGIAAYFITGSKNSNAQKDLYNELGQLFLAQRSRATSMNVATYILFNDNSIEPRIGNSNICTRYHSDTEDGTPADERYPIRYYKNSKDVAIDLAGGSRTLDSESSNKYVFNGTPLVSIDVFPLNENEEPIGAQHNLALCFQPNGQVVFMNGNGFQNWAGLRVQVDSPNSPGYYFVEVTGMGFIRMYSHAK